MARYLSDEWFDQLGATAVVPCTAGAKRDLVLQHIVANGPEGDVLYHVRIAEGAVSVVRGQAPDPDVTFAEDYATAAAVVSGELTTPAALLGGRIRVGGDMTALVARQGGLPADDPIPPAVRAATTY